MKIKLFSIVLCFILIITAFAGCKRNEEENTTTSTTTTTETTTETITEEPTSSTSSQNKKVQRDKRLVGKWNAATDIVIGEKGETVTSKCTVTFKKDGSFSQITSEKQARQMIVDTYLISFGCKNEKELEEYIRKNTKLTLEAYIAMAMADMTENDFNITGTWKTENNNTLYETTFNGTRNVTEITKYTVSNDGNTVKINIKNGDATVTMVLTKA
ncbi:MAG: hypothetical protein IIV47_00800 [Clostridia bacterium]|nr:hypothetical protein [Clostridia bacterium]